MDKFNLRDDAKKIYASFGISPERWEELLQLVALLGKRLTLDNGYQGIKYRRASDALNELIHQCRDWREVLVCAFTFGSACQGFRMYSSVVKEVKARMDTDALARIVEILQCFGHQLEKEDITTIKKEQSN